MTMRTDDDFQPMFALLGHLPAVSRSAMVRMYRSSLQELLDQLAGGLQPQADLPSAVSAVHRIAGAAGMMQDQALCAVARAMETELRDARPEAARKLWPQLQERCGATLAALEQAFPAAD